MVDLPDLSIKHGGFLHRFLCTFTRPGRLGSSTIPMDPGCPRGADHAAGRAATRSYRRVGGGGGGRVATGDSPKMKHL